MINSLTTSVQYIKGVGPKRAKSFDALGIHTIEDLLYYFPRRYEDRRDFISISKLQEDKMQTIRAEVLARGQRISFRKRTFSITEVVVCDETGKLSCVWFNQPYLRDYFKVGQSLILYGKVERYAKKLQMTSPEFEITQEGQDDSLNIGRIVPVYSLPAKMTQRNLRKLIKAALDEYLPQFNDFLPYDVRARNNLLNLAKSLLNIHFPENPEIQNQAYARLSFEEFLLFQIPLALRKLRKKHKSGITHKTEGKLVKDFLAGLPFKLTAAQEMALAEIKSDMASPFPMQRLLQGDVGSGKTVVATIACLIAAQGGYQAAFMAPTEILARQHYEKIRSQDKTVRIELLTGSAEKKEKERILRQIKAGEIDLIIGTHALLEERVSFGKLGLVVIDEQHKFGVGQRALLSGKGGNPDVLIMTATPIPRTLAITLYGDLDISVINELPPGRGSIQTILLKGQEGVRAYSIAKEQLKSGNQVYIVYPVIEESYALDIAGAKKMYSHLKSGEFKDFRLGLIHGRLKQAEQDVIMGRFKERKIDVLVSTTVLEVGIDIPSATCMIVEHAERFGLSQLHQLRGRVGRGARESFCILLSDVDTEEAAARLQAMAKYSDGFRIAEEDLRIRGPGEFFGHRQHGLTELRIGNPLKQMRLLKTARDEANRLVAADVQLSSKQNLLLKEKLLNRFPEYEELVMVG